MPFTLHKHRTNLEKAAASELKAVFAAYAGNPILFLSSGGSALALLEYVAKDEIPEKLTVGMLDERVSRDPAHNNFLKFAASKFYWDAKDRGASFLPSIPHAPEDIDGFASRLEKALRDWKDANPEGVVIATMGIGEDSHTAGIIPAADLIEFAKRFDDPQKLVAGFDGSHVAPHTGRVSVTLPFLHNHVDVAIVFVKGDAKKPALDRALDPAIPLHQAPAGVLRGMKDARIFTDSF
jgi:6-phosphogluconolactonase/glucosamine-6-phosphate isomerase/deaminase